MTEKSAKLWGGRFTQKPHETFAEFNDSFPFDKRLFAADVRCSIAHVRGLQRAELLTEEEADAIAGGLTQLLADSAIDPKFFDSTAEDVHSFIESKLIDAIGDVAENDELEMALRAQVLTLPTESDIAREIGRDVDLAAADDAG